MPDWRSISEPATLQGVLRTAGGMPVPWMAAWTGEDHGYVARPDPLLVQRGYTKPCLFEADGRPGDGHAQLAVISPARQRESALWVWPGTTAAGIVDGDTFDAFVVRDLGFYGQAQFHVRFRLARINAPKSSTAAGKASTARLAELLAAPFALESGKPYKYGGEWMADVTLADGRNVSDTLVAEGHAVYWDGTGPRPGDSG